MLAKHIILKLGVMEPFCNFDGHVKSAIFTTLNGFKTVKAVNIGKEP
jgi:hypothetical protein